MHRMMLVLILSIACCVILPAYAVEAESAEPQEPCNIESDETCTLDEDDEELERGFDPCLINASLPACKADKKASDSSAAEKTPSDAKDSGDPG